MDTARIAVGGSWVVTLAGVVAVVLAAPAQDAPVLLALVLALAVFVGMVGQLIDAGPGFVLRLATASCGSLLIVLAGALALLIRG